LSWDIEQIRCEGRRTFESGEKWATTDGCIFLLWILDVSDAWEL